MRTMQRGITWVVGVGCWAILMQSAGAQSLYSNVYLDIDIYTDVIGYAGGCSNSIDAWSDLNGNYQTGYAGYPDHMEILESAPGIDGIEYPWDYGFFVDYNDPYTGQCGSSRVDYSDTVATSTTYYTAPDGGTVWCTYTQLACTSGTPRCGLVPAPLGVGLWFPPSCPTFVRGAWLIYNGRCDVVAGFRAGGGGPCN